MAPFALVPPTVAALPLTCDSPHSGACCPDDYRHAVPRALLRRAEDTDVEALWQAVPAAGGTLLHAHFPRSYIDVNRTLDDLDPQLLDGPWSQPLAPGRIGISTPRLEVSRPFPSESMVKFVRKVSDRP